MATEPQLPESSLRILYDLLRDATRRTDLKGVFHVLFRGGREGLGAREGLVARHNPETGSLEILVKTQGKLADREGLLSAEQAAVGELLVLSGPLVRRGPEAAFFVGSASQLAAPIPVDAHGSGLLVLESDSPTAFGPEGLSLLKALLEQTASVIRTRSSVESSRREAAAWWEVGRRMVSPADLDVSELSTLLGQILQLALARTKTTNGIILMADEKSGELVTYSQAVMGDLMYQVPDKIRRRQRGRASGIVFQVLDTNKPRLSNDIETDPNYIPLFKGIKSHLSVPISFQDRCIGVIVVEAPAANAFTLEDQKVLEELSNNIVTLVRRAQLYEATRDGDGGHRGVLIRGLSSEWKDVERRVERAAATNATVILRGESGTGKELVAHAIHFNSRRKDRKLIVVNSAAIPDQLLESTLFGHVRGAFTGASYDRVGEFEKADGGTVFLDEIGELGLPLQVKLLRVLQTGEIQKVGSNEDSRRVDVRVIAATSRDLEAMMKAGQFREDLYYRLHVVPIWLPALRQFKKSLPGMIRSFVEEAAREFERPVTGLTAEALELLLRHDYPGNVRELKNIIEQAVIMAGAELIGVEDLPAQLSAALAGGAPAAVAEGDRDFKSRKRATLERFEREYLHELLSEVRGNISRASELSGINRVNFYKLLRRHEIDTASYR
jgi:transcriptional regulator with GAF, ATPase, and Fis domain